MFRMNLEKYNSPTILKILFLFVGFFLINTFTGILTVRATCVPGPTCPAGQTKLTSVCPERDEIDCVAIPSGGSSGTDEDAPADKYGLGEAAKDTGLSNTELSVRVSTFIGAIVGFVGVIFLVLMIYGGLTWMTAGGNEEKVGKAKKIIVNSTIGIVIVMLSYAITYYIITTVSKAG